MGTLRNLLVTKEPEKSFNIQIDANKIIVNGVDSIEVNNIQGVPSSYDLKDKLPAQYIDSYPHIYSQNGQVTLRVDVNKTFYLSGNHLRHIFSRELWEEVIIPNIRKAKKRLMLSIELEKRRNESWKGSETITL